MTEPSTMSALQNFIIRPEKQSDEPAIEALLDQAFGKRRKDKTTYRFREGVEAIDDLSFVAEDRDGALVGTIRFWPVKTAHQERALLLGPLAVERNFSGNRCGLALMERGIEEARGLGERLIILIGDEIYYGKAGFKKAPKGHFIFPGPVEADRVLALELVPHSLDTSDGTLSPFKA